MPHACYFTLDRHGHTSVSLLGVFGKVLTPHASAFSIGISKRLRVAKPPSPSPSPTLEIVTRTDMTEHLVASRNCPPLYRLPTEVLSKITKLCTDHRGLYSLATASKPLSKFALPLLWREITGIMPFLCCLPQQALVHLSSGPFPRGTFSLVSTGRLYM